MEFIKIEIQNLEHQQAILSLMNDYMLDKMGVEKELDPELGQEIIAGLKIQNNYVGFLVKHDNAFVGLANCFIGFSTFKAKQLLNIHDFVVTPNSRGLGCGKFMLSNIVSYSKVCNYAKVTLEVRYDNPKAQSLYKSLDFVECDPPMYFWQHIL